MLLNNNPELDLESLKRKLAETTAHRRRNKPTLLRSHQESAQIIPINRSIGDEGVEPLPSIDPHQATRRIPLIGGLLAKCCGRLRAITAPDLRLRQRIALLPLVGASMVWLNGFLRMNTIRQQIAHDLDGLRLQHQQTTELLQLLTHRVDHVDRMDIANRLKRFDAINIAARLDGIDSLDIRYRLEQVDRLDIGYRLDGLDKLNEQFRSLQAHVADRDNRIAGLTQELRQYTRGGQHPASGSGTKSVESSSTLVPSSTATSAVNATDMDSFYFEFEAKFRGTQEDISSRLEVYLPYVEKFANDAKGRVVDIGCGRGEWLRLLTARGIDATGIDLNQAMVDECRSQGMSAECSNAIDYLLQQTAGSLAVISGFHIIEHLNFDTLIALFDAALRALRDDGLIIFETPNPENLLVGSCNFYYDPTHQRPIAPPVAEFIAMQRGFAKADILRLHAYPDFCQIQEQSEAARRFNAAMYGPQDYAVIAWKTHAN
jgi:2-polyprenyl-3-methyl-5-hydroxy-6-metoxy-1,4-benzoquinol methylase